MTSINASTQSKWQSVAALLLLPLGLTGCSLSGNRNQELVEARLRQQDDTIRDLERRLQQSHDSITALKDEAHSLRLAAQQGVPPLPPEQADSTFRVTKLDVNSLMSGGIDRDQSPGDDQFTLLLSPRDSAGNVLRVAGEIELSLFDFTRPKDEQQIGHWTLSRDEVGEMWHQGIVGTGYQFTSGWQQLPVAPEVHVHARLKTVDGRQFDTTSKLRVTPPSGSEPLAFEPPKKVGRASVSKVPTVGWTKSRDQAAIPDDQPPELPEQ